MKNLELDVSSQIENKNDEISNGTKFLSAISVAKFNMLCYCSADFCCITQSLNAHLLRQGQLSPKDPVADSDGVFSLALPYKDVNAY